MAGYALAPNSSRKVENTAEPDKTTDVVGALVVAVVALLDDVSFGPLV